MPGCNIDREVKGSTAIYRICGRFEGACAWDLAGRLEQEPLANVRLDFSQCGDFVDYGVAVLANALLSATSKHVRLDGLRTHQVRLFKYFGVDADEQPSWRDDADAGPLPGIPRLLSEVA